jgi:putative SbcD/Mre11-related phosphoesterase
VTAKGYEINHNVALFPGGAALLLGEKVLVVADLHLGYEASLESQGFSVPRIQTRKLEKYVRGVVEATRPRRIVVAGDLKHNFSKNLTQEWNDVTRFVRLLADMAPLEVVKGNHDNYLASILAELDVPLRNELFVGDVRIVHGHSGKLTKEMTIMGHIHPAIRIRDDVGASVKDQCFLYEKARRVLVLPALSLLAYGTDVVGQHSSDRMSPVLSDIGLSEFVPVVFSGNRALSFPTVGEMRGAVR